MERIDRGTGVRLQVLTCVYGADGARRFEATRPPVVPGVEYVVSWQLPEGDCPVPDAIAGRNDIRVVKSATRGLSRNRNLSLALADAPFCLIGDDDVVYDAGALEELVGAFDRYSDVDIICCKSTCHGRVTKPFPEKPVPLGKAPYGWYATSFEIAFRRGGAMSGVRFNENFGIGAPLMRAGEEDLFLHDAGRQGARGMILPLELCRHDHDSTSERSGGEDWFVMTRGAVLSHIHPRTWLLRLLRHALRQDCFPVLRYFTLGVRGACHARRRAYFK